MLNFGARKHFIEGRRQLHRQRADDLQTKVVPAGLDPVALVLPGDIESAHEGGFFVANQHFAVIPKPNRFNSTGLNQRASPPAARRGAKKLAESDSEPRASINTRTLTPRCRALIKASQNRLPNSSPA